MPRIDRRLMTGVVAAAVVLALLVSVLVVRRTVVDVFRVPSTSMTPALAVGELILTDRRSYGGGRSPGVGDVVVFGRDTSAGPETLVMSTPLT